MGRTACTEPQYVYKGAIYLYLYIAWLIDIQFCIVNFMHYNAFSTVLTNIRTQLPFN